MRSVSKRFPDEFQGQITNMGQLTSIRKRMAFDKDNQDRLADCKMAKTVLGRKRLIPYLVHFGKIQERHLWKKNPEFTF